MPTRGLLLLLAAAAALFGGCLGGWVANSTECPDNRVYTYTYQVNEEYFDDQANAEDEEDIEPMTTDMTIKFEVQCIEIGTYDGHDATMFNMSEVNATEVEGDAVMYSRFEGEDVTQTINDMNDAFKRNTFHFIVLYSGPDAGNVPATYYNLSEIDEIANLKKTLASCFQSRLNRSTTVVQETDPQSTHISTYSFSSVRSSAARTSACPSRHEERITQQMTRTITDGDVIEFSSSIPDQEVEYSRTDNIYLNNANLVVEYNGQVNIKLVPEESSARDDGSVPYDASVESSIRAKLDKRDTYDDDDDDDDDDDEKTYDADIVTNYFNAKANHHMEQTGQKIVARSKRSATDFVDLSGLVESTLLTYVDKTKKDIEFMTVLRSKIGEISDALVNLQGNPKKTQTAGEIETLVKLEAKYGPVPGYTPAVDDVIDYLNTLIGSDSVEDANTRLLLYYILSPEGSLPAQMALLNSLENANDDKERENVLFYLAFVNDPQPQMVARMERLISSDDDPGMIRLAYSSMVPRASPNLQERMMSFLLENLPLDADQLTNHILALGNTESLSARDTLLSFLRHPSQSVQLASIFSLQSLLNDEMVQNILKETVLNPRTPSSHITMVARCLMHGAEEARFRREPRPYLSELAHPLVAKVANVDNEELHSVLTRYLTAVNSKESHDLLHQLNTIKTPNTQKANITRLRRGTDWAEANKIYNLVSPLADRQRDVQRFPDHLAYIWGRQFGGKDVNLQIAAGGFAGLTNQGEYKVFGRGVAQAYVFGYTKNFIEFTVLRDKSNAGTFTKLYAYVMGKTLKNVDLKQDPEVCKTWTESLYEGKTYTIFDFTYSIFVYVGTLNFGVKATIQFSAGMELNACEGVGKLSGGIQITPGLTFTVGATGSLEIVLVAKAGVTVDVSIKYELTPGANIELCLKDLSLKYCVGVYDRWKDSKIDLYAWYAWRGWCGWWLCSGSKAYKKVNKIDAFSFTWKLSASKQRTLTEQCNTNRVC